MRHAPTEAERLLWSLLRGRRFVNYKFRRQVPMGRYIVDFFCPAVGLIVELDGSQHAGSSHDEERDGWLRAQGYTVLRVWNSDLNSNRDGVSDLIYAQLEAPA